jgi:hypothetical protein
MLRKISIFLFTLVFAGISQAQCVGSFGLTRTVHGFVTGLGNKWISWLVFLVFIFLPVYGIAMLVDAVVLNSVQFWTGKSLVRADFDENGEHKTSVTDGDERLDTVYRNYGEEMVLHLYKGGQLKKSLLLKKDKPGRFFDLTSGSEITVLVRENGAEKEVTVLEGGRVAGTSVVTPQDMAFVNLRAQMFGSVAVR